METAILNVLFHVSPYRLIGRPERCKRNYFDSDIFGGDRRCGRRERPSKKGIRSDSGTAPQR
jgi:hypothetical protein